MVTNALKLTTISTLYISVKNNFLWKRIYFLKQKFSEESGFILGFCTPCEYLVLPLAPGSLLWEPMAESLGKTPQSTCDRWRAEKMDHVCSVLSIVLWKQSLSYLQSGHVYSSMESLSPLHPWEGSWGGPWTTHPLVSRQCDQDTPKETL